MGNERFSSRNVVCRARDGRSDRGSARVAVPHSRLHKLNAPNVLGGDAEAVDLHLPRQQ